MEKIRGKSVVIFKSEDRFLFTVCNDTVSECTYYIPVGGGIEFGEQSIEAAKREVFEETGRQIENIQLLDISENIFFFNGIREHEIVFTFYAEFKDKNIDPESLRGVNDQGKNIQFVWADLGEIKEAGVKVYPLNLLETLQKIGLNC